MALLSWGITVLQYSLQNRLCCQWYIQIGIYHIICSFTCIMKLPSLMMVSDQERFMNVAYLMIARGTYLKCYNEDDIDNISTNL